MRLTHDREVDALYIYLSDAPYAVGHTLDDARRVDYGVDQEPCGGNLLAVSRGVTVDGLPHADKIAALLDAEGVLYSVATGRGGGSQCLP